MKIDVRKSEHLGGMVLVHRLARYFDFAPGTMGNAIDMGLCISGSLVMALSGIHWVSSSPRFWCQGWEMD